ncbi:MAG: EI24 domain-containing protein [Burkholderiaceae bacterium]|nr:EI24 domain-containing protein [Burkholderiaceae bacterium]
MKLLLDSFWRAAAYCLHPRVIGLSVLPLLIGVALALGLSWLYWESAVAGVRATLENWQLVDAALKWVETLVGGSFRAVLAPLIVVGLAAPVIVLVSVLLVAWLMTPAIVDLVAMRRFPALVRKQGAGLLASLFWSLAYTVIAGIALVVTVPLWLIPPLVLVVPPLIWGWLNYKVMSFDVLATHASADERHRLMHEHRLPLLGIGVVSGYLGAAPSLLWAFSAMTLVLAPVLIVVSVWLYTLVFGFSALWFAHYALAALAKMRGVADREADREADRPGGAGPVIDLEAPKPARPPTALLPPDR